MIELSETGNDGKIMVFITADEVKTRKRLFTLKPESATYYQDGEEVGHHWLLRPVTVAKMFPGLAITKLTPE